MAATAPHFEFLLGKALLISPIYEQGNPDLTTFLPQANWLDFVEDTLIVN